MEKKKYCIEGMTCSSCEVLIERKIKSLPTVSRVLVDRAKKEVTIEAVNLPALEKVQEAVGKGTYTVKPFTNESSLSSEGTSSGASSLRTKRLQEIGAAILFIAALYLILKQFDLLPSGLGITDNMSYGFIFAIGLVAATSTCLAVSGGLLLALSAKYHERFQQAGKLPQASRLHRFQPHLYFNAGRIVSYTVFGALIGLVGSVFTPSSFVTGAIMILASVFMIIIGLQLLHIFPFLDKVKIRLPKFIAHKIYDASEQGSKTAGDKTTFKTQFFSFGAGTFFLPCGFTQALQLYVLSKGDWLLGGLTMLFFTLGTLPALLSIGAVSSFSKGKMQRYFTTVSAVLIIILGLFNLPNGFALTGAVIGLPSGLNYYEGSVNSNDKVNELPLDSNVKIKDGRQIVQMAVNGLSYSPASFTLRQGVPVEWRIDGRFAEGCAQVITAPALGITEYLPKNQEKIITFTPPEVGPIKFSCTMGMAGPGVFNVVPNEKNSAAAKAAAVLPKAANAEDGLCDAASQDCNAQEIFMEISREKGFSPNTFTLKRGIPIKMTIDTKVSLGGCMGTMVIPEYNVAHRLSLGTSTLTFTPTKSGTFPFTCSMGSKLGEFIVN